MKVRNYEKKNLINIMVIILIMLEILVIFYLNNKEIYKYKSYNAIVLKDNTIVLILNDNDNKIINKNSTLYLNSKKVKYKIIEDRGYIINDKDKKYREILLEFNFDKKYRVNDTILISLKVKKMKLVEIFKIIWEGD